jgi:hypothetical protein
MKTIDLGTTSPTLTQVLELASEENVILRTAEGRQYVLAEIDDFAEEVAKVAQNQAFTQLLREQSKETAHLPLSQARERLHGKTSRRRKGKGR